MSSVDSEAFFDGIHAVDSNNCSLVAVRCQCCRNGPVVSRYRAISDGMTAWTRKHYLTAGGQRPLDMAGALTAGGHAPLDMAGVVPWQCCSQGQQVFDAEACLTRERRLWSQHLHASLSITSGIPTFALQFIRVEAVRATSFIAHL